MRTASAGHRLAIVQTRARVLAVGKAADVCDVCIVYPITTYLRWTLSSYICVTFLRSHIAFVRNLHTVEDVYDAPSRQRAY
jgi:hypothetical protein